MCHLFDRDKKQYHCGECGICRCGPAPGVGRGEGVAAAEPLSFPRIGPEEDFFHCSKCNLCLSLSLRGKHKVRARRFGP